MILGVIPARYGSTRFPGKVLARIQGKPMVQWVWEQARQAKRLHRLVVATDDQRIVEAVRRFGGEAVMSASDLNSGTDRVWAVASETKARIVVNLQGDEPLLSPAMVDRLVEAFLEDGRLPMATLRFAVSSSQGYTDPNVVKVVTDAQGWALYFSRSSIPAIKGNRQLPAVWYKHIGLYAYRRRTLEQLVQWPPSALEKIEGLEQLRALEHGVKIKVLDSPKDTVAVDTREDLERVEKILSARA